MSRYFSRRLEFVRFVNLPASCATHAPSTVYAADSKRRRDLHIDPMILPTALIRIHERGMDQPQAVREIGLDMRPFQPKCQAARGKRVGRLSDIMSGRPVKKYPERHGRTQRGSRTRQREPAKIEIGILNIGGEERILPKAAHRVDAADFLRV